MEPTLTTLQPLVHLNGTSARVLREGWAKLAAALRAADEARRELEFNSRDYPDGRWDSARDTFTDLGSKLAEFRSAAEEVAYLLEESL